MYFFAEQVLFRVVERHAGDLAGRQGTIKLVYGDESIPILYETSRISQIQLPGQPGTVLFSCLVIVFLDIAILHEVCS